MSQSPLRPPRAGRWRGASLLLRGLWAWCCFGAVALVCLPLLLTPSLSWRRRLVRRVARLVLTLSGAPLTIQGMELIPVPAVVVANHCSYLDGVVLTAALPPHFGFVIKREMHGVPLAGWLLRRIGSHFVERGNRPGSARDALRVIRSATQREALVFFPEGTFQPAPGLLRFHTGAFAAAVSGNLPLVPVALRGTRERLPPGALLPRPGPIGVVALPALLPEPTRTDAAAALRDAARAALLAELGEPDLASHS